MSAPDDVSGEHPAPHILPPDKESRYPLNLEAGYAPGPGWTLWGKEKYLSTSENRETVLR
jgi:hypothetical protein